MLAQPKHSVTKQMCPPTPPLHKQKTKQSTGTWVKSVEGSFFDEKRTNNFRRNTKLKLAHYMMVEALLFLMCHSERVQKEQVFQSCSARAVFQMCDHSLVSAFGSVVESHALTGMPQRVRGRPRRNYHAVVDRFVNLVKEFQAATSVCSSGCCGTGLPVSPDPQVIS